MADLLDAAREDTRKSNLASKANLDYDYLTKRYLPLLLKTGLLQQHGKFYRTTAKGYRFLETWKVMKSLMREGR